MSTPRVSLTLVDGVQVVVPDALNLITPYVLIEQQDWFEEELAFLREALHPGATVIDIGANYGVYALSLARVVGAAGAVFAFEPASSTAACLAEGIATNGFSHVLLDRTALSNESGRMRLTSNANAELNALDRSGDAGTGGEIVEVATLDACRARHGWQEVHFLKIDAEGEESNILQGATRFLAELSPLVQFEVKVGVDINLALVDEFAALGYDSYRLVPGLGVLAPLDRDVEPDPYLLNLFAAKPDRAAALRARGHLVAEGPGAGVAGAAIALDTATRERYGWRRSLATLPYGTALRDAWETTMATRTGDSLDDALTLHAISRDTRLDASRRYEALRASYALLLELCAADPSGMRPASLARVARDWGARAVAVRALGELCARIERHQQLEASEPFLPARARFDSIAPGGALGPWVLCGVLEAIETASAYSSFYVRAQARARLELIASLGFPDAEMARRLQLVRQCFPG